MIDWSNGRRILITTDPIGGVWQYVLELAGELAHTGLDIAIASMGRKLETSERAQVRRLPRVELFESAFKLEWMSEPWRDVAAAGGWLRELACRIKPSLIHLNQFAYGALVWDAPCLVVGHSCVYSWFRAVRGRPPGDEWRSYHRAVCRGLRGADRVSAPSRWMLSELQRVYGGFAAAEPIYNGRSAPAGIAAEKRELVLTAGRLWDDGKNVAILERIAPALHWPIFAAGPIASPDGSRLTFPNLSLLGRLEDAQLGEWMRRAAIFVAPARYEPFGLTVLEAALAGCALVLGDIPSLREIWQGAALFAAPDNADEIGAALVRLIADAELREQLGQQAQRRASTFTPARMAREYIALYRQMVSGFEPRERLTAGRPTWLPGEAIS